MGAPGKSTGFVGMLAMIALALADVSFSASRVGLGLDSCLSKKAWKPSGIVFGKHGGVSGRSPPYDVGRLRGEISSDDRELLRALAANGNRGELRSGSVASHPGLAGSYSCPRGAGISSAGHTRCAGSYSFSFEADVRGLEAKCCSSLKSRAKGEEL